MKVLVMFEKFTNGIDPIVVCDAPIVQFLRVISVYGLNVGYLLKLID